MKTTTHPFKAVLACCASLAVVACVPAHMKKPADALVHPGFFDVGAGYTVIPGATAAGDDADGFLATIKAYPGGRWYAPMKKQQASETAKSVVEKIQRSTEADDAVRNAAGGTPTATQKQDQESAKKDAVDSLSALLTPPDGNELYQFECSCSLKRAFVFYGHSVGGYDALVDGGVDAIGVGYDITPELGLVVGHAHYKVNNPGGTDTNDGLIVGVQLNLSAFKAFRQLGTGDH